VLATTEGSQITGLCAEYFDWAPLLDDPRFLLAYERPTERPGLAAALESLRMLVVFADDTGRTGLVRIRDFLPHLLLARSPEIAEDIVARVFGDLESIEQPISQPRFDAWLPTALTMEPPQQNPSFIATPCSIASNASRIRLVLDLQNPVDQNLVCLAIRESNRPYSGRSDDQDRLGR
jgi:hypothetical protein